MITYPYGDALGDSALSYGVRSFTGAPGRRHPQFGAMRAPSRTALWHWCFEHWQVLGRFACGPVQRRGPAALARAAAPARRRPVWGASGGGGSSRLHGHCKPTSHRGPGSVQRLGLRRRGPGRRGGPRLCEAPVARVFCVAGELGRLADPLPEDVAETKKEVCVCVCVPRSFWSCCSYRSFWSC